MAPDGAGLPAHPTGPQRSDWRRINYCTFCCCCTFRTILSVGFPKLEHHDVLIRKTQAINQHAQQAFAPGPLSRAARASSLAGHPSLQALSTHPTASLCRLFLMCLLTHVLLLCLSLPQPLSFAIFLCPTEGLSLPNLVTEKR